MEDLPKLRSYARTSPACYRFVNKTRRVIKLVWINFRGLPETMRFLRPDQFVDINTYNSHPWLAIDADTRQHMTIEHQSVLISYPCLNFDRDTGKIKRDELCIYLPMRKLREIVMWNLVENKFVKNSDDVKQLGLPNLVEAELSELVKKVYAPVPLDPPYN